MSYYPVYRYAFEKRTVSISLGIMTISVHVVINLGCVNMQDVNVMRLKV
jgi:hypothetical protein